MIPPVQDFGEARGSRDNLRQDLETGEIKGCRGRINGSEAVPEVITVTHVHPPPSTVTNRESLHMMAWRVGATSSNWED
jgi:hypothetical protein